MFYILFVKVMVKSTGTCKDTPCSAGGCRSANTAQSPEGGGIGSWLLACEADRRVEGAT